MNKSSNVAGAFFAGAVIGAIAAMLTSPASGAENRRRIREAAKEKRDKAMEKKDQLLSEVQEKSDEASNSAVQTAEKLTRRVNRAAEEQKS